MFHQSTFSFRNLGRNALPIALLLSGAATAQVTVTDHGLTAPTLGANDTGYTGTTDQRFGWDTETVGQTFTVPNAGTIGAIYLGYNAFENGDTITLNLLVNGNTVATGLVLDGNNFSGVSTDGNGGPFYWMKFDLSAENVPVTAGLNSFSMTATANSGVSWALAPNYKAGGDLYSGGAMSLNTPIPGGSDLKFAVTVQVDDVDGDNLPDSWELSFPGVTTLADLDGTLAAGSGPGAGTGDFDGDGLSDFDEYTNGTNPTLADSDNDGIDDLDELDGSKNPFKVGHVPGNAPGGVPGAPTDPNLSDSDDDGILDGEEVATGGGGDGFVTNPNSGDTDGDVMTDLYEVTNNLLGGLDPTDSSDGDTGQDLDGDGIDNFEEHDGIPQTRADKADTDDDGYNDLDEDNLGSWFSSNATGTNPANPDTDGDGLMDGQENPDSGVLGGPVHNSDPNVFDTDGDLYGDGDEVTAGTDPSLENGAASVPTGIPFLNVDFTNSNGSWTGVGATSLETSSELLLGSGKYVQIDGSAAGNGIRITHGNPVAPFYCSVDLRIEGTLTGSASFNILSSGSPGIQSEASTHCILRLFGDGSVQAFNGTAFLPMVPVGGIVPGVTYTAQIEHDIVAGSWSARVYNRASGTIEGEITGVPDRPTSNPAADPLYFTVGFQGPGQSSWDVSVDNMIVSLQPITVSVPNALRITGVQFDSTGQLIIDFSGANLSDYEVTKSLSLQSDSFAPLSTPLVVTTDANGIGQAIVPATEAADPAAFYRIEDAP